MAGIVAALAIALSGLLSVSLALLVSLNLGYGLGLLWLERWSGFFRDTVILNLLVTFPVSGALNVYAYLYLLDQARVPGPGLATVVVAVHILAFLHLEFGRKLRWPHLEPAGGNGYARALGVPGAFGVCAMLGVFACTLASWMHGLAGAGFPLALLPWVALLASAAGLVLFLRNRSRQLELKPFFGVFLMSFFALNILVTVSGAGGTG